MNLLPIYLPVPLNPEKWEDIPGYEGVYQMSNLFRFRSLDKVVSCGSVGATRVVKGKILVTKRTDSYNAVDCWVDNKHKTKEVHRIVAAKYCPNTENKPHVNHINGKKNNFHPINLEWCTQLENNRHAFATGLNKMRSGEANHRSKLNERTVKFIKGLLSTGLYNTRFVGNMVGMGETSIRNIRDGKTWREVAW